MSNPVGAFKNTYCDDCGDLIEEGDDVFLCDGEKLCTDCADRRGNICDCGNFKKEDFDECYECHNG